jgi:hypothetical protein
MSFGRVAYEAYRKSSDGKSLVSGQALPEWDGLHERIKQAWEDAALSVLEAYEEDEEDAYDLFDDPGKE